MLKKAFLNFSMLSLGLIVANLSTAQSAIPTATLKGHASDAKGQPLGGVMITAFDAQEEKSVSVFTRKDGSFSLPGLPPRDYSVRARLIGLEDQTVDVPENGISKMFRPSASALTTIWTCAARKSSPPRRRVTRVQES